MYAILLGKVITYPCNPWSYAKGFRGMKSTHCEVPQPYNDTYNIKNTWIIKHYLHKKYRVCAFYKYKKLFASTVLKVQVRVCYLKTMHSPAQIEILYFYLFQL